MQLRMILYKLRQLIQLELTWQTLPKHIYDDMKRTAMNQTLFCKILPTIFVLGKYFHHTPWGSSLNDNSFLIGRSVNFLPFCSL